MRVLLSTYGSRGDVEPMVGLAVRALGAEGCDALVATGMMQFAARSVTEKLGIRYVYASYQPTTLPSPHHPPHPLPGRPFPPDVTDHRVLNDLDAQSYNALFGAALNTHRASIDLPPVDNVRDHIFTDHPWLAADHDPGPVAGADGPRRRADRRVDPAGRAPTPG